MYQIIKNTKPGLQKYADKLISEGVVNEEEVKVSLFPVDQWPLDS
jgi:2-oxoglutarate dehydrogenase complex dehydrogenase (E1) component-like enzyme